MFTVSQTVIIAGKGSTSSTTTTSVQPVAIIAADMNGDGRLDLVTTNNEGSISVLLVATALASSTASPRSWMAPAPPRQWPRT